jgi:hypothetical protein
MLRAWTTDSSTCNVQRVLLLLDNIVEYKALGVEDVATTSL